VNAATLRTLAAEGCEVIVPQAQGCCGALSMHAGRDREGREFAKELIAAFEGENLDAIIVNAASCGSNLKDYGRLLGDEPGWAERAAAFAGKVRDVSEFLAVLPPVAVRHPIPLRVAYHDACHLAHAQGIRSAPRQLLTAVPGLALSEMAASDVCCGSAGIYNVVNAEMSMRILARKMQAVNASGADIVATANPGCMLQLEAGVRMHGSGQRVMHVVEVLDLAYRNFGKR
jgi:glycolate oxidase iron-sulfur subunit